MPGTGSQGPEARPLPEQPLPQRGDPIRQRALNALNRFAFWKRQKPQEVGKAEEGREKEQEGLRVNFTIDNKKLIAYTLASSTNDDLSSDEHREDIIALQKLAWETSQQNFRSVILSELQPEQFRLKDEDLESVNAFLEKLEKSSEFVKVREQTEAYLTKLKAGWEENYPQTSQIIQGLTGLDLNKQIIVLVSHPSLRVGWYLGNDTLAFGHNEDEPNYSIVNIWHEIMHSYFDNSELSHALINLIANNELRVKLDPEKTYPPLVWHEDLLPWMERMLPYWQAYLQEIPEGGKRDIQAFQAKLKALPEFQEVARSNFD